MSTPQQRGRRRFLLIAVIFFTPMILAYAVYFGPEAWKPSGQTNHGELQNPVRPLELNLLQVDGQTSAEAWQGQWTLLQLLPEQCDAACESRIVDMRQLRTSLHRHRERVQRLVLLPSSEAAQALQARLQAEHPLLRFGVLEADEHARLQQELNAGEPLTVVLVDPLGNYLLRYTPEVDLRGMYKDIKRVLKLSNIG